jgi:hypothetical protein
LEFYEIIKDPMATMSAAENGEENQKKKERIVTQTRWI